MIKVRLILPTLALCTMGYCQEVQKPKGNEVYKDTLGNVISSEVYKEKMKSGLYSATMMTEGDNVSFILVNKKKAEKDFFEQTDKFKNSLLLTKFPDFSLKKLDGSEINSNSLAGKTLIFNFWFIGCKPCISEMPLLNEVVDRYKSRSDIVFIAPALDGQEKLLQFFNSHTFSYQVAPSAGELAKKMNIYSYPTHILVDSQGMIQEVMIGGRADINKVLKGAIDKILPK